MAAPTLINHRRDRQQTRRVLAAIRTRCRDLTGSFLHAECDLLDGDRVRVVHPVSAFEGNRR